MAEDIFRIPVFERPDLRDRLVKYVDRSLVEVSVKESEANLGLIESLSPSKMLKESNKKETIQ
jgi:hypothetical protein